MSTPSSPLNLSLDYELMENYVMGSPLVAFTQLAAVTDKDGLPEAFLIGGSNASTINHLYQDKESDTGWNYYSLPAADDNVITAIAAIATDAGRVVAVSTSGSGASYIYVTQEAAPYSRTWYPWSKVGNAGATQLVLRFCYDILQLGAVSSYGVYGPVTNWLVVGGPLTFEKKAFTWNAEATPFHSDLPLCDFIYNYLQSETILTGCVSPTLSLFPATSFVNSPIWSTAGASKYGNGNQISIFRPIPGPTAVLLSDLVVSGNYSSYASLPGSPSVLCAGSVEDASGSSGRALLIPATGGITRIWNSGGTKADLSAALWQPLPMTGYTQSTSPSSDKLHPGICWFSNEGKHAQPIYNKSNGQLTVGSITFNLGLISNNCMGNWSLEKTTIFTTTDEPSRHELSLFNFQESWISNCFTISSDTFDSSNPAPTNASFPANYVMRVAAVVLQSVLGSQSVGNAGFTNAVQFSNWCQVLKDDGTARYFAVDDDQKLWFVDPSDSSPAWEELFPDRTAPVQFAPASPTSINLTGMQGPDGVLQIFGIGADSLLYCIRETAKDSERFEDPVPISSSEIGAIALVPATPNTGAPRLFAISNSTPPVLYYISLAGKEFTETKVQLESPATQKVEQISAYTIEAILRDSCNALVGNTAVSVVSTQPCTAIVNGAATLLRPGFANTFKSDVSGGLHMVIPTADINAPTLTFSVAGQTGPLQSVALNAKVLLNLSSMTAEQFISATDASGQSLFPDQKTATAAGNFVTTLCKYAISPPTNSSSSSEPVAGQSSAGDWEISFDSGQAAFSNEGNEREAVTNPDPIVTGGVLSWLHSKWDDFKHWLLNNGADVRKVVVKEKADGLHVYFRFIYEGEKYEYKIVLQTDAADFVNSVLDVSTVVMLRVGATLEQITQWLSVLFDWTQIKLAQQAVQYTFQTCFLLLKQSASDIKNAFDDQFTATVFQNLSTAISSINASTLETISSFAPDPTLPNAVCNFFSTHLREFCDSPQTKASMQLTTDLDTLLNSLIDLANPLTSNSVVTSQEEVWDNPVSPDQVPQQTVSGVASGLESIVSSLISTVQDSVDGVLGLAGDDVQALYGLLNTPVEIPWVSDLYQLKFGSISQPMTVLGLLSAAIAIPAVTALEALAPGTVPFPNGNTDLDAFESSFTPNSLLAIWGLAESGWQQQVTATALTSAANWLAVGALFTRIYLDQILDAVAASQITFVNMGSFVLSTANIASSLALFASAACKQVVAMVDNPNYTPEDIVTAALALNGAQWAIDTLFTCAPGINSILRLSGDPGVCLDMAMCSASASLNAVADGIAYGTTLNTDDPPIALAGDVLSAFAAIGHIGLLGPVVEASGAASVAPALLFDFISDEYGLLTTADAIVTAATMAASAEPNFAAFI